MELINSLEAEEATLELKYCERCGGLWLRARGEEAVYCAGCTAHLEAWALPKRRRGLKRRNESVPCKVQVENILGVAAMEVEA